MGKKYKKQSYFRLLSYLKPYKGRLIIGVVSGMLVGGSLLGMYTMLPSFMLAIDPANQVSKVEQISVDDEIDNSNLSKQSEKSQEKADYFMVKLREVAKEYDIEIENESGQVTVNFLILIAICMSAFIFLRGLAIYVNRYFMRWIGSRIVSDLRNQIFEKLLGQSLKFYGKHDTGQLISRSTNDTASLEAAIANVIADITRCPVEIGVSVYSIYQVSSSKGEYSLLILLFICLPILFLPILIIGRIIRKIYHNAFAKIAIVVGRMQEVFTCITAVKAYNAEKKEYIRFKTANRKYFRNVVRGLKFELFMNPIVEIVGGFTIIAFFVYAYANHISLTLIVQLLVPVVFAYKPFKQVSKITTYIQRSMAAADRYFDLLDNNTEVIDKENPISISSFNNKISFNNVNFSYENDKKILNNLSLDIAKGDVVAVVGETGSGKTTIANLIARFYDIDSGTLLIDDYNIQDIKIEDLRNIIGIVTQDTMLFNETIEYNIAYGLDNVPREKVIEAAKSAKAHDFIVNGHHEEGYDTVVGEKGFKLSGGEKQRVAIARAILKNPPILILDEATSALDTVTENLVQEALNNVMKNRTVFAIAHRLSTIQHADKIIVLDKGQIIESGTHKELLEQDGAYKKLHDTQFGK